MQSTTHEFSDLGNDPFFDADYRPDNIWHDPKALEKKHFMDDFQTKKGKQTLQRVFARDGVPFQPPQQSRTLDPEEIQHMSIRKQYKFDSEVKQKIMQNPKMSTMHMLLKDNVMPTPPIPDGPGSLFKAAQDLRPNKKIFKLAQPEPETNLNQKSDLAFDDVKEFYFVNLVDIDLLKVEDVTAYRKKELKEQIIQLGKRMTEFDRLNAMIIHPRTTRSEKDKVKEKMAAQQVIIDHAKERIHILLKNAPFTLDDVAGELREEMRGDGESKVLADKAENAVTKDQAKNLDTNNSPSPTKKKVNPFDEEDPKKYKQITMEKVKKARKFLQITFVDARAIKNRLGASSISELIDAYREYEQNNKLDQLEVIIQESLCSKPRRQFFMEIIKRTLEMEEREHLNYKTKGLRAAELNYTTYSNNTQSNDDPLSDLLDDNGNPLTTEAEYLYSILPFWYVDYTVPNEKTEILRDKFKMDREICAAIQRITKMKTLNDLVSYYRQNRTVKDYSLFTPEEVKALKDRGWTKEAVDKFIKSIVQLAKEALLVPKYVFTLVRPDADIENLELDGIKGLPLGAISGIVGSLIANDKKLKKLKLKNMGLNTDSTFILQLLVANPINELIELDFSKNPIKDDGVINILKAFKANPKDNVQIIRFDECWMGSQGASSFSSYLRQTNFSTSLIPIQVLTLSGNQIGNVGFETLCFTLKSNATLKYLDLSNNSIIGKITSISALVSMLQINKTLKVLYLVGNKFDSDNTLKLLEEIGSINQPTSLAILKIGPLITTADNVAKFIEFGLAGLSNLRYCEITSPAILNDQYSNIDRVVKGLKGNRVVRATADTIVQEGKRLINLLSDMIYGGITLKETVQLQGNTKNPKVAEFYENLFQEIAENKFKIYTTECIALLTESYIAYDYELKRGDTFIHRMAQYGHIEAVKYLLESDADPNSRTSLIHPDFPYATLLHVAVASGSLDLIKQLLTRQAIIDAKDMNENSPLHYGASLGKAEICDFLMTRGCAPNIKNKKRMEPMHAAILSDDIKTIEVFIKKMNPYLKPEWSREFFERKVNKGHTGLMLAVEDGAINSFHYILRYGVKLNDTDEKGRTALHYAVEFDRYEMIDSLLRNRANVNVKDITGETPMFLAVRKGDMDVIQKLYDFQSRLDVANTKGDTLLHEAAKANNSDLISWMLERGLDWRKTNYVGKIPRDYATAKGARELLPDQQSLPQYNMYADDNDIFTSPILNNTNANNPSSPGSPDVNKANGVGEDVDDDDEPNYNDDDGPQYNPQKAQNLPSAMVPTEENRYPRQASDTSMIQQNGQNNTRSRSNTRPGQSGPAGYDVNASSYQPRPPQRQSSYVSGGSVRSQTPQKYQGQNFQPDNVNKTMIDGSYIDTMDDQSRRLNKIKPNGSNLPPLANNGKGEYRNQDSKNFPEASRSYYSFLSELSDPKKAPKETNGLPKIDNVNKRK